jgi:hypothetical protein
MDAELGEVLEEAWSHFCRFAPGDSRFMAGGLLLADRQGDIDGAELDRRIGRARGWELGRTGEAESWAATSGDRTIFLIAGRQLTCSEDLEVLALATIHAVPDGLPLVDTVARISEVGGLPVLPWGVGKWFGRRGLLVSGFLESPEASGVFLGDNGGRPLVWPTPTLIRRARARGIPVLPGSDALPLKRERYRTGSFGFRVRGLPDPRHPAEHLRSLLNDDPAVFVPYGHLERVGRFIRNQVAMQWRKRRARTVPLAHRSEG